MGRSYALVRSLYPVPMYTDIYPFPKRQSLDSAKPMELINDNLMKMEKSPTIGEENTGKRRNCSSRAVSPFPAVFSNDLFCRYVKKQVLVW